MSEIVPLQDGHLQYQTMDSFLSTINVLDANM